MCEQQTSDLGFAWQNGTLLRNSLNLELWRERNQRHCLSRSRAESCKLGCSKCYRMQTSVICVLAGTWPIGNMATPA
jgi:hypothetical protein